jgi:hypothetical protein
LPSGQPTPCPAGPARVRFCGERRYLYSSVILLPDGAFTALVQNAKERILDPVA